LNEQNLGAALCSINDIPDGGSEGFFTETSDGRLLYMVVRQGADVFVYKNACPHTGMPLDFQPGRFLTADGDLIQCSTHGAKFQITDGLCVIGPCHGDRLESVPVAIRGDEIYLTEGD